MPIFLKHFPYKHVLPNKCSKPCYVQFSLVSEHLPWSTNVVFCCTGVCFFVFVCLFFLTQVHIKRTNASILSELDVQKELLGKIMTLKLAYFGHIMRGSGSPLTLQIVEGMVEGKRKRGRQKKQWFDNIREWTGLSYMRAKRSAQNRSAWRRTIKKCAEGGRQSSGVTAEAR